MPQTCPDAASVNLSSPGAYAVMLIFIAVAAGERRQFRDCGSCVTCVAGVTYVVG